MMKTVQKTSIVMAHCDKVGQAAGSLKKIVATLGAIQRETLQEASISKLINIFFLLYKIKSFIQILAS